MIIAPLVVQEDLERLSSEWEGLLDQANVRWPFLRPSWQQVWWAEQEPAGSLLLLSVRDGERLVGVAPLLQAGDELSLAGDSSICDYMDIVAAPGMQSVVLQAVLDAVSTLPWRRFSFWGIRADSPTLPALRAAAERAGLTLTVEQEAVCPRVILPDTWDGYLLSLSKKDRHELRRKIRRFSEAGSDMREYALSEPAEVSLALDDFFHLHTISRQDKAEFMTPAMQRFFRGLALALSEEGLLRLWFLELEGRRVASLFSFDCGDELWLYNSGYDPAFASVSVGLVSKALALRQAIADGKRCYDFLRGAEPYKYDLGARDLEVFRCTLDRDA